MAKINLVAPTINVNDDKITLGAVLKINTDQVTKGDVICSFETSKATEDFISNYDGFLVLTKKTGDEIPVGSVFGYICDTLEEAQAVVNELDSKKTAIPEGFKASKKAIEYAKNIGFDITLIKKDGLVKVEDIDSYLSSSKSTKRESSVVTIKENAEFNGNDIVIVGGGGLALMVIDAIEATCAFNVIGILDDYATPSSIVHGYEILGGIREMLPKLHQQGLRLAVNAVSGMTSSTSDSFFFARAEIANLIKKEGYIIPNIIHPSAIIERGVKMGEGNIILSGANIGSKAVIGNHCYINTNTMISHECVIGNFAKIAPGAILAGRITLGENTLIGMGATIYMNLKIGKNVIIYNGVNVFQDVSDNKVISNINASFTPSRV